MEDSFYAILGALITGLLWEDALLDLSRAFFAGARLAVVAIATGGVLVLSWKLAQVLGSLASPRLVARPGVIVRARRDAPDAPDAPVAGGLAQRLQGMALALRTVAGLACLYVLNGLAVVGVRLFGPLEPRRRVTRG
ncbi:MAG TPA: hypothetical protein VHS99_02705 [Chloroflexota bacterium]|nr:hypothetical protein [Chloroflexota bacterium]